MARHTIEQTIERGICTGCGACAFATGGAIEMMPSPRGILLPLITRATPDQISTASRVCPFSDDAPNEDELGPPTAVAELHHDSRVGAYTTIRAGRSTSDDYLTGSSSGGLTSWLAGELLRRKVVDGVLHVGRAVDGALFGYTASRLDSEIAAQRKSHYFATSMNEVLARVRGDGMTYAIVGVPCFIRAVRLLCKEDAVLREQLKIFIGLVCGHLKSAYFAESLAWQVGVEPWALAGVDFRLKNPERASSDYDFGALRTGEAEYRRAPTSSLVGGNWGHGAFQPEACNFCDDIFAETADIAFGDGWLPQYTSDWRGTNVIVSRNRLLDQILQEGQQADQVWLEDLALDDAARSQAGNFRHRRDGLAIRLADDLAAGLSVPEKRVAPDPHRVGRRRRRLIRWRRQMSELSTTAYLEARRSGDLRDYLVPMRAAMARYRRIDVRWWRRVGSAGKRLLARIIDRVRGRQGRRP